ncbi:MAG: site-specific DNA-methyltransferase, partial [Candidatus Marinimicrobia bacterium]|nr:site-specific DNA-methyltransferase [Candidatus Neomarinimicrobiota bacterium]
NPKALICDGFCGSGSTLIAAYKESRRSIGFEISEKWYKITRKRIKKEVNKIKLFE